MAVIRPPMALGDDGDGYTDLRFRFRIRGNWKTITAGRFMECPQCSAIVREKLSRFKVLSRFIAPHEWHQAYHQYVAELEDRLDRLDHVISYVVAMAADLGYPIPDMEGTPLDAPDPTAQS